MKIYKLAYGMVAAALMTFTSCSNDYPTFDDADAFVAMTSSSAFVSETGQTLKVPVMLTSLSGIEKTVEFTLTPDEKAGAVEGTHYRLVNSSKSLSFTKENPTQYIEFEILDNNVFEGDVKFTITLTKPEGLNLGANNSCIVTIEDDEHPLAFILGSFTAKGISYYNGEQEWTARIEKDANDLSKVWIYGFVPGGQGSNIAIYGTVNAEKTQISIPVEQTMVATSSYDGVLICFYGPEGDDQITDNLVGDIAADGTISFKDWFGTYAYNAGTTTGAGWFNIIQSGAVFTKNK